MNRRQEFNSNSFPELLVEERGTIVSHRKRQPDPVDSNHGQESPSKKAKHSNDPQESSSGNRHEEATATKQNNLMRMFENCRKKAEAKLSATSSIGTATLKEANTQIVRNTKELNQETRVKNQDISRMSLSQETTRAENRITNELMNKKNETTKDRKPETIGRITARKHEECDLNKLRRKKQGLGIYSKRKGPDSPETPIRKLKRTHTTVVPTLKGQRKINDIFIPCNLSTIDYHTQLNQRESPEKRH